MVGFDSEVDGFEGGVSDPLAPSDWSASFAGAAGVSPGINETR